MQKWGTFARDYIFESACAEIATPHSDHGQSNLTNLTKSFKCFFLKTNDTNLTNKEI